MTSLFMVGVCSEWKGEFRVQCLGRCTGLIGFQIELVSGCDVRVSAILGLRFMMWSD